MTHGLSPATIRDLKHLRDGIQLALAHAQASKDKEKFVLPLKEYRRAVDLVLTVGRLRWNSVRRLPAPTWSNNSLFARQR
jgi:hypothetical protein